MHSLTLQWLSLVGVVWLQLINGTNSDFSAYSSQLKHVLSISQLQLNNLAFASDAGKLFGWFSGIATVHLPLWLVLLFGSLIGLIGYGVQFLFLVNKISSPPYWQVFMLSVLAGNSTCWINTVCYVVAIKNFPYNQVAVGLSSSYLGLSAKVYTDIVDAFFPSPPIEKAKAYLLLNSILPVAVSIIAAPIVRRIDTAKARGNDRGFIVLFLITIATEIYAVIGSLGFFSSRFSPSVLVIGMGVLLVAPLVIPAAVMSGDCIEGKWRIKGEMKVHDLSIEEVDCGEILEIEVRDGKGVEEDGKVGMREEIGAKLMLKRVEFWLYFFIYMFGATLGLVFLNNLGQIAESRGYSKTSSLVSLSSSFGFFGRAMPSLLDYFFSKSKYMVSRPGSILVLMAPMAGAFFLLLNTTNLSLYISTAIIGICTGAITSTAVSATSELFGNKNFSVNHNLVIANIPVGSFLFGYLAALLYRSEGNARDGRCIGFECYRKTFIIWGSFCCLGTLLAFFLYTRTRKYYLQLQRYDKN